MISGRKYVRAAVFYGLFVLVTGGFLVLQNMSDKAVAGDKPDVTQDKPDAAWQFSVYAGTAAIKHVAASLSIVVSC